jgi:voltage-gated potassium channel
MTPEDDAPPYVPQSPAAYGKPPSGWRRRMYDVIFEADTPAGRRFGELVALIDAYELSREPTLFRPATRAPLVAVAK